MGPWSFVWVSPCLLSTLLAIPCRLSRVHGRGLKQNAVGGVLPNAPSTLCGFPTVTQGSAGLPVSLRACRTCTCSRSYFQACPAWFRFSWLTYQARYVRVQVPRRAMHASCESPWHSLAKRTRLGGLLPPQVAFQEHAAHPPRWPGELSSKGSSDTCISDGVSTFLYRAFTAHGAHLVRIHPHFTLASFEAGFNCTFRL